MIRLIDYLRSIKLMQIFVVYLRYLIGLAFILAALLMGKLNGVHPFTLQKDLNAATPIELFFHVMTLKPLYWHFIGWFQIVTGILLVTQRFAKLGALLFFGMMVNIWLITLSFQFTGTPIVTGLMCLAAISLLGWDYAIFMPLLNVKVHKPDQQVLDKDPFWQLLGIVLLITAITCYFLVKGFLVFLAPLLVGIVGLVFFVFNKKPFSK